MVQHKNIQPDPLPPGSSLGSSTTTPASTGIIGNETVTVTTAFCVKCKKNHEMVDGQDITLKNGRSARKGTCKNCKTPIYKLTKKKNQEQKPPQQQQLSTPPRQGKHTLKHDIASSKQTATSKKKD